MAYQAIGIGSSANDGTGDNLRVGADKVNDNFVELYTLFGTGTALTSGISADANDVTFTGASANAVWDKSDNALEFADNAKATFGTGADLSIHWDGTDGHLAVTGTLNVEGSGETLAKFIDDGAVELYHNDSKKFETSSAGISVTGTATMSGNVVIADAGTIGSASDTDAITIAADGKVTVGQNLTTSAVLTGASLVIDNIGINANDITSSTGAINITPVAGSAIVLDGTISIDAGVVTGATSITSTAFVGALTGNASTATSATSATSATTAGTVTTAAQTNITSVGTLTALTVDNVAIDGTNIGHTSDTDLMSLASGAVTVNGDITATGEIYYQGVPLSMWITTRVIGLLGQG
jgi:hypothetical protein